LRMFGSFLWSLIVFVSLALPSSPSLFPELNSQAVPSLVILGVAKGGTTDLWDLLHIYHKGFHIHSYLNPLEKKVIHPWKELDFFSLNYRTNVCFTDPRNCSVEKMTILLNCPTVVFESLIQSQQSQGMAQIERNCLNEITKRKILPSLFTATASPALLYSASSASKILMKLSRKTKASPLFLLLLRNPIDWIISMYNHGMV
jgi:hypothetical protein